MKVKGNSVSIDQREDILLVASMLSSPVKPHKTSATTLASDRQAIWIYEAQVKVPLWNKVSPQDKNV